MWPGTADDEGVTATTESKVRRRRQLRRTAPNSGEGHGAPSALLTKARTLIAERRWRAAVETLAIYRSIRPDDGEADELTAIAAAHAGKRKIRDEALARLTATSPDASAWEAIAVTHLATSRFLDADRSARKAIDAAPRSASAWGSLAASYAGLGWFGESGDCLDRCEGNGGLSPLARWQLGRATNRWAMGRSHAPLVAMLATMVLGNVFLGLAVALTTPLAVRELRVSRLEQRFRDAAEDTWRTQHRLRLGYATGVLASIGVWVGLLIAYQP